MRRGTTIAVTVCLLATSAVAGAALGAPSTTARRGHRPRCLPHAGEPVAQDKSVLLYRLPLYVEGVATKRAGTYACAFHDRRTVKLKDRVEVATAKRTFYRPLELSHFVLAGTFVAYEQSQVLVDVSCSSIVVVDVTTGRSRPLPQGCSGPILDHEVTDLVVDEYGSIAWIAAVGRRSARTFEVRRSFTGSRPHDELVYASAAIAPNSLRLAPGGEVSWLDGGRTMYAELPRPSGP